MRRVAINELAEFVLDGTHGSPARTETGVPVLSAQNVRGGELSYETSRFTSLAEYDNFQRRLAPTLGDILLTIVGTIGRSAVMDDVRPLVFQRSVAVIRPKTDTACSRYLYHAFNSIDFQAQLKRSSNQSSQAGVYLARLKKLEVPLPPLAEQRRIATILDQADALRAKRRAGLAKLDTLTQAIFIDMFGRATQEDVQTATITDVAASRPGSIRTGPFGSQLLHSEFVAEGVAVLGIDNAVDNEFRWDQRRFISEKKYQQLRRYTVYPGDVLITLMGTCGRCAVVPDDVGRAINTKHLCCITLDPSKCLPEFLQAYFLLHPVALRHLQQAAKGAIMSGLSMGVIKDMPVLLPPVPRQLEFVQRTSAVTGLRGSHRTAIADVDALFASLQHRAFRGDL